MAQERKLTTVLRSDKGRVRELNEDAVAEAPELGLVVLADGMGGHNAGEVASALAVNTILDSVRAGWPYRSELQPDAIGGREGTLLRRAIEVAHAAIREMADSQPQYEGMGTTVVTCLLHDGRMTVAHVGDSRLYRLRGGELKQITRDHSLVEDLITKGFYSREEARQNVRRNILTRALGSGDRVTVDLYEEPAEVGDVYLLCSDGLTEMVNDEQIRLTLQKFSASLDQSADRLVALANEHGGKDNVSVALVRVEQPFVGKSLYQVLKAWV
ncbi:MAG TPA: Stp1/IreP family PP2C-type Ser/Thr phosphatase [Nevskiales bacterium]|nr:Stp1/IreP family PP2C-type Ser/Thr phosphatase [Nevskiales bacterium]